MKKILEVLQYGESDLRFNTDLDVRKNPNAVFETVIGAAVSMQTTLWGGNEISVLAMLRALAIADLACSVNRSEMVAWLDEASQDIQSSMQDARREMERRGISIQTFPPGVSPSGVKS